MSDLFGNTKDRFACNQAENVTIETVKNVNTENLLNVILMNRADHLKNSLQIIIYICKCTAFFKFCMGSQLRSFTNS